MQMEGLFTKNIQNTYIKNKCKLHLEVLVSINITLKMKKQQLLPKKSIDKVNRIADSK